MRRLKKRSSQCKRRTEGAGLCRRRFRSGARYFPGFKRMAKWNFATCWWISHPIFSAEKIGCDMLVDFAPYLFRGKMNGFLTRLSATGLANVTSGGGQVPRSEEHTSELQSHSFISYAV